ncbi:MAG: carbohydrate-binding domain-containing protein [Acetobacteraceae bacterium]|nr:carbohydrate-binding domain-containing protein [Acetobacteraceae bacterium]
MSGSISNGGTIGSGSDAIVLNMSEDSAAGTDAQFTVNVDGQQIGGRQTVTASHAAGQDETFTFLGNYAPGPHTVTVTFANNFLMPGTSGDRNVYVDGVNYDGQTISSTTTPIYQSPLFPPNSTQGDVWGNAVYSVIDTTAVPAGAPSTPTTTPSAVSVGSGSDTLVLNMAEDAYLGDAQFTVAVDGVQVGGTQTTTASLAEGQQQEFDVHGNWGAGNHTVAVTFTNDAIGAFYPGTQLAVDTTDRNLYVMGMTLDGGTAASGAPWELATDGTQDFTVTAGNNTSVGSAGSGSSTTATTGSTGTGSTSSSSGTSSSGTSDTATVDSSSLGSGTTGSGSGMSFVAPTSGSGGTSNASSGSAGTSADTTAPTVASSVGGSGQSAQDWTVPAASSAFGTRTSTHGWAGHGGPWSADHQNWQAAVAAHHQG